MVSNLWENDINCPKKFDFEGVYFGRYAICDAIYTWFQTSLSLKQKTKNIFRENCFENVVSDLWKKKVYVSTKLLLEKIQKLKTTEN